MFNLKCSVLAFIVFTGACAFGQEFSQSIPPIRHSIMRVSSEWMQEHQARRQAMPFHRQATPEEYYFYTATPYVATSPALGNTLGVNFAADLNFTSCGGVAGWNQGSCGNCWVWGCTAASSASYGLESGAPQLFSVQWFDSDYYATTQKKACNGGDSSTFASWYNSHPKFIPWSNTNAGYADSAGPSVPAISASSIGQTPSVSVTSISASRVVTNGVTQSQAIANIKAALDAGHPIAFSFYLPGAGWTDFENAWSNNSETTPWADVDNYNGSAFDSQAGGHLVCIVGYDNTNNSWVILNSWGTTSRRPNGFFEIPEAMNYGDTMTYNGSSFYQYEFDVLTISGWPSTQTLAITTQPVSQTVNAGAAVTFSVAATGGTAPYKYQWYKGGTAINGATSASYTLTTTSADTGTTFYVKVTDSASSPASVTSSTVTLTVNPVISISIAPSSVTLTTGGTQQFTATVAGTTNTAVSWSATAGTISSTGLCTAPATASNYSVTATSVADSTKSASALVTVTASTQTLAIATQPVSQTVNAGAAVTFSVTATGGTAPYKYQWYKGGTAISGATSASYTLTTTSADTGTTFYVKVTDSASSPASVTSSTVTLTVNPVISITISPSTATLAAGGTQQFTATVAGTTNTAVTWSATSGTVSSSGLYTAPTTAGSYTVKAVSSADSTTSASASVTVSTSSITQLIQNPGFESGTASWSGVTSDIGSWGSQAAHGGSRYCWLNGYGTKTTEYIQQAVTIPSTATKATLTFWLHVDTAETTKTVAYDVLNVQVIVGSSTSTLAVYSNLNSATGYSQKSFDLSAYKGKAITIKFLGAEDSSLQTSFVIDDVNLNVQ